MTLLIDPKAPEETGAAGATAEGSRVPSPSGRRLGRRALQAVAAIAVAGILIAAYLTWVSTALLTRHQGDRIAELKATLSSPTAPHRPAPGAAMALLEVPSVGFEQVVAEGTTPSVLDGGPGHVIGSALPGQAGRAVFTGRRWTSGAPFAFVPALQRGTSIYVTDVLGRFHYVVSNRTGAGRHQSDLVLITAAGPDGAPLSVSAHLDGEVAKLKHPKRHDRRAAAATVSGLGDWVSQPASLVLLGLLGALLVGTIWASWTAYRRWNRRLTWMFSTPILVALSFAVLAALAAQIPVLI